MKTKNVVISALSALSVVLFVLFMFSFTNTQNIQYKAVVSLDKIHIIYLNFENPVTVVVPGVPKEKVIVKCVEAPVKSLGGSKYSIPVKDQLLSNKKIHLSVFFLNNGKEQYIETIDYLVLSAPDPMPYYANKSGGAITMDEILRTDTVNVALPGFYYEGISYKVSKFLMVHVDTTGFGMTLPQDNGYMLSPSQKASFSTLHKGDKIVFSEIYATYIDPVTKKPIEVKIPKIMEFTVE